MTHIFISYSSKDRALIDEMAADLELLIDGGNIWYDRELNRSGGHQWWNLILEEIRRCDVFIYALSPQVLKSEPCKREYGYAKALGKPILPVMIGDVDIRHLPVELQAAQLVNFRERSREQQRSLKASIRNLPPAPALPDPLPTPPETPLDPVGVAFDRIARLTTDVEQQRLLIMSIEDLSEEDAFRTEVHELLARLIDRDDVLTARNLRRAQELQQRLNETAPPSQPPYAPAAIQRRSSLDLLPAPFAWVEIPGGKITIDGEAYTLSPYRIARYPLTNAQYRLFVEAGGYDDERWWTAAGWAQRHQEGWTQPRYWTDSWWNGAEQPVVGVSWYEGVAYCQWLSSVMGEGIMLPTEAQWQYAAQGDDRRDYPWGREWDCRKCNNAVKPCKSDRTTPVRQYEGKGDSPFGVVDMAGNVWEWCLTAYESMSEALGGTDVRVLRGGSWYYDGSEWFRCDYRGGSRPLNWDYNRGLRLALS